MPVFDTLDRENQSTAPTTMKFLIVLSALAALAAAKPGVFGGLGYSAGYPSSFGYSAYSAGVPVAAVAPTTYSSVAHAPAVAAYAAPAVAVAAAPVVAEIKTQYHAQDAHGQASYGHTEPFQAHSAVQDAHGNKIGSFSYVAPNGQVFKTEYVADALGYRVASNALPVGPGPVHDTPEVVAARAAHLSFHHRGKRGVAALAVGHTPAATAPLAHAAVVAPAAYASPLAYSAGLTHSYAYASPYYSHGLTTVVSAPALSYIH